jgi:hypothetical protein
MKSGLGGLCLHVWIYRGMRSCGIGPAGSFLDGFRRTVAAAMLKVFQDFPLSKP